jgi:MoxR-like ATPase
MVEAVNAALYLRRPLLLTGRPGSGKSSLIQAVAHELLLGPVLRWHVTSRSTLQDALYRYDAIGRLQAERIEDVQVPITDFLRLGPLGTALLPGELPRALLIDEIDKSEIDLPNDLLDVFERGEFEVPELTRLKDTEVQVRQDGSNEVVTVQKGKIGCREFPFVVLTSNGERDFPGAFLRRCIRLQIPDPSPEMLAKIVAAHLGSQAAEAASELIAEFAQNRSQKATDQLMNAVYLVTGKAAPESDERARVLDLVLKQLTPDA